MLYLIFEIGADRYALAGSGIVAVGPMVVLKRIPQAPPGIAGVFSYHGQAVPVVDMSAMALGQASREDDYSTRIIVVADPGESGRLLGLMAEKATETAHFEESDFQQPGVAPESAPYMGPVANAPQGMVQRVSPERLLTPAVKAVLWTQAAEAL
jgi:chemotaxis-related protein WspB